MTHMVGIGFVDTNISIDQILPAGGYTEDNIQLVCYRVNQMKGATSMDELYEWCKRILQNAE